jgi:hypothetical protein
MMRRIRACALTFDDTDQKLGGVTIVLLALTALPVGWLAGLAGVLAGAMIGILVSRGFSRQASKELRTVADDLLAETETLKQRTRLIMRVQEDESEKGQLWVWDPKTDEPIGKIQWGSVTIESGSGMRVNAQTAHEDDKGASTDQELGEGDVPTRDEQE